MERGISDFVVDGSFGEFRASVEMVTKMVSTDLPQRQVGGGVAGPEERSS